MASSLQASSNGVSMDQQAQLNGIVQQDAAKGRVAVHTFNPDATPQEKAAAAGKSRDQVKSNTNKDDSAGGKEVPVAVGGKPAIPPTITVTDADKVEPSDPAKPNPEQLETQTPGAMPQGIVSTIPDWYKAGWRAVGGIDEPRPEGEEKDKAILDLFISDMYYGDWYHNAAIIFFAVFASHFLTLFRAGWGWLVVVLAICSTYYTTSLARVRRRARDDIQRELVKNRLMSEHESADWINNFLDRFWLIYEPVLSQTIISSVDQILSQNTPAFLDSIRLHTFTLGTKAPRIDKVRTFPRTADDIIMMDWGLSFTPNDVSDITPREAANKVNPKIVLNIRVGKGLATATMPVLLENMSFTGLMRIRMKLMTAFPHVQVVDLSFLNKPEFDYVLKPIGGETLGFDISNIPGLSSFIREMVHATLGPMMYDPNVFTLNLEQLLSGEPLDTAIGVLQVTVHSARGITGVKIGGGTPDPYVSLSFNKRAELSKTSVKEDTYNPSWNETKFLLVNSLSENLTLTVLDYNDHRKDHELGVATFDLSKLLDDATQEGLEERILKDGKDRGHLRFDVSFFPVLKPQKVDGKEEELPETKVGIVRLVLHQAKDLDSSKSLSGDLNPFAKVYLSANQPPVHATAKFKHTNSPVWESPTEFLCSDRQSCVITVKVIDDRDFLKDPVVGYMSIRLEDLLYAKKAAGRDWWPLSGCKSGRIRLSCEWKPLNMAGSLHGADQYVPPIGIVRLWVQKATDVKNVEAALGGKRDPYVRVQINNVTMNRTEVINNNLNPEWDQIIYIPVHSLKELMLLECMDYQHLTKDRSLGSVELRISELAERSEDPDYPYKSTGKKVAIEPLRQDKGNSYKGNLHYVAEFIPAIALKGLGFASGPNELQRAIGTPGGKRDDSSTMSSSDFEVEAVPVGITATRPLGHHELKNMEKTAGSIDTSGSGETEETAETAETGGTKPESAPSSNKADGTVEMSKEDLLKHQHGVIIFDVRSGQLSNKGRLEVLLDEGYWPAFSTVRARSTHAQWDYVGEGFIKELDFGRVWLRLNKSDEGEKDDIISEFKCDAKVFLEQTLDGPATFTLVDEDNEKPSTVEIEARYLPVDITLEPRESINNMGVLRVDLLDGQQIRGVDRSGKSDPFVVFTLNDQKVHKSQTKKKTLNPDWNENFTAQVPSRVNADFSLEVFDWNQIEQAKSLGWARITLDDIEPFEAVERSLTLSSEKHGDQGVIRLRLLFTPEIIAKARKNTSTFSSAGRAMTQVGSIPLGAGKGVLHGVGKVGGAVGGAVTGVFRRDKDKRESSEDSHDPPSGQISAPAGNVPIEGTPVLAFPSMNTAADQISPPLEAGILKVTVLRAKDLPAPGGDMPKPYVVLGMGDREHKTKHKKETNAPEWNELVSFNASAATPRLHLEVFDHRTLAKDRSLGEADIDIWRHVQAQNNIYVADVTVELRNGQGLVQLRLDFEEGSNLSRGHSMTSMSLNRSPFGSPSRFSLSRRTDE